MSDINALNELPRWFEVRREAWQTDAIMAQLKLPNEEDSNQVLVTFETPSHIASITVWGTGLVECIVLDLATVQEKIIAATKCESAESLWPLLDSHIHALLRSMRTPPATRELDGEAIPSALLTAGTSTFRRAPVDGGDSC